MADIIITVFFIVFFLFSSYFMFCYSFSFGKSFECTISADTVPEFYFTGSLLQQNTELCTSPCRQYWLENFRFLSLFFSFFFYSRKRYMFAINCDLLHAAESLSCDGKNRITLTPYGHHGKNINNKIIGFRGKFGIH